MTKLKRSDIGAAIYYRLRDDYLKKIPYGNEFSVPVDYDPIMKEKGLREDHIAFRAFKCPMGNMPDGIESIARIFKACGWRQGKHADGKTAAYDFPDMHLKATHLEYPEDRQDLPKIFISELLVNELELADAKLVRDDLVDTVDPLTDDDKELMKRLNRDETFEYAEVQSFINHAYKALTRPWKPPHRKTILQVNERSQYAPWTLLNGGLNHIAYLTKDLDKTAAAHQSMGRELLPKIMEDDKKTLRQTSVRSPMFEFEVTDTSPHDDHSHGAGDMLPFEVREDDDSVGTIMWTGPFAELIERPLQADGTRREDFLPGNAAHIFAATRNRDVKPKK